MAFAELRADEYAALSARALEVESALAFREHHPLRLAAS